MAIIKNEAVADLTQYSAKALCKIKSMTNVAVLIIPADAPSEYYEALTNRNVAAGYPTKTNCRCRVFRIFLD